MTSRRSLRRLTGRAGLVLAALALTGCAPATTADTTATGDTPAGGTVTVLAAASLSEPLTTLAAQFERDHPGVQVRLSVGSSTTLAQQIAEGAPADLFASAGEPALALLPPGAVTPDTTQTLARNVLEIATPPDDPGGVAGLADLGRPGLAVVLCASTVPCGAAADRVLHRAGVSPTVVSREVDVKATLTKVTLGEADAAIVYHSDVVTAGDAVRGVEIPPADNVVLAYPLVRLTGDPDAAAFADYLTGPDGAAALGRAGFLPP